VSQPPYPYGAPQEPSYPPPADPYQPTGYPPPYADQGYPNQAAYPPTQPYPNQPYSPDPNQGYQPYSAPPQQYSGGPAYPPAPPPGPPQYLNYPGYPQPTPPKSGGGTAAIIAVVAVLLVLVVGGGIAAAVVLSNHGKKTTANSTPTTGTSAGSSSVASPAGPTHPGDLRTFLVAKPSGARDCANQEGTNENLSLDQAAQLSSNPSARKQTLQQYDYTKGAVRCWVSADKTTVDLRLYQFDSPTNAHGFFTDNVDATSDGYDSGNITDVTGVPGGKSFGIPKDSDGYASVISIGLKGDVVLVVALAQQPGKYDVTVSNALLKQLYDKL
jgi:hypothetical protein